MPNVLNIDGEDYNQFFSQIIDSVEYILHVYYNSRSGWYISFYDADLYDETATDNSEALIYGGRKLMPNQNVLKRVYDERLPSGALSCLDLEYTEIKDLPEVKDGTFGEGYRYRLVYFTEEEVAEYKALLS